MLSNVGDDIASEDISNVFAIDIPRKVSRPKIKTAFQPDDAYTDVDEGHFLCPDLGKTVLQPASWAPGERSEKIAFSADTDEVVLNSVKVGDDVSPSVKGKSIH